jgi:hypothetical protein
MGCAQPTAARLQEARFAFLADWGTPPMVQWRLPASASDLFANNSIDLLVGAPPANCVTRLPIPGKEIIFQSGFANRF